MKIIKLVTLVLACTIMQPTFPMQQPEWSPSFWQLARYLISQEALNQDLRQAARDSNITQAEWLINQGAQLNSQDEYGYTALTEAALNGHQHMVQMFIDQSARLDLQTKNGRPRLIVTIRCGRGSIAHKNGDTVLIMAIRAGYQEIAQMLIDAMLKPSTKQKDAVYELLLSLKNTEGWQYLSKDTRRLIAKEALENIKQENKAKVLEEISKGGHRSMAEVLIKYVHEKTARCQ